MYIMPFIHRNSSEIGLWILLSKKKPSASNKGRVDPSRRRSSILLLWKARQIFWKNPHLMCVCEKNINTTYPWNASTETSFSNLGLGLLNAYSWLLKSAMYPLRRQIAAQSTDCAQMLKKKEIRAPSSNGSCSPINLSRTLPTARGLCE